MLHLRNVTPCKPISNLLLSSIPHQVNRMIGASFPLPPPGSVHLPAPPLSSSFKRSPVCWRTMISAAVRWSMFRSASVVPTKKIVALPPPRRGGACQSKKPVADYQDSANGE